VREYWWLGAVLPFVGAVGCADESPAAQPDFGPRTTSPGPSTAGSAGAPTSHPPIDGFWATFANEMDGTVVKLQADGNQVTGRGCLSGWQEPSDADGYNQCGAITGTIEGNQVSFAFDFGGPAPWDTYEVDAQLLDSGTRMNGEHSYYTAGSPMPQRGATKANLSTGPVTVFRPPTPAAGDRQWPWSEVPIDVRSALARTPEVTLISAPAGKFSSGTSYELETVWGGLHGDVGVFAPVDLAYERPEAGVIVVRGGPAPQAEPDSPVGLTIEIRDEQVVSIEAELASGEKLSFAP
jgi:hypothetical protein